MGRKLDDLWDYAERSDKRFKCRFCLKYFTGGVVRLRSHLSGVKGGGIQLCSKVSEEAKNDALSSVNAVNKKRKTEPSSSDSDGGSSEICDANCNSEVGYSLAKFFLMAGITHNMVESSSFTSLVKALSPGSALPSSLELESKLIPSFKTEVERYVSGAKKSWIETGCTLIPIFELNEKEGRSFLSIFGCSRERTVLLNTFEVPINTDLVAPFLEEAVHSVVEAVGSDNIVQCILDVSQYGGYFSKFLGSKFPHVYLTNCAAHEVQLMFEEICQDVGWVGRTFSIIKSIVDYIWSDTAILALMRKYTNGKELKQSLDVNLLSSYKMLESILEVKQHLVQLVQSPEWLASGYVKGQRGREVTTYIEDPKTWELGEKLEKGLRSLSKVLCLVDFHGSSSGYFYGLMEIVEHSISQLRSNNQDMYQRLFDIYMLKKGQILSEFHSVAAFLNPAYMRTEHAKNVDRNPIISYILGRFIAENDQEDFVNEVYKYRKILSDGSKLYETTAAKAYHPCQWWETFGQKLPILKNLAIRILSQPCSTSTCKSSMLTVEAVLVKEQRKLARGITDLDVKMNAILMERFNKDKSCEREKVVLEEFNKQMSNNGESTSRPLRQLKLCFTTLIASPIRTSQNVEGEKGRRIHVCLEDPITGRVVQDGIPSMLPLTISVFDGHFSNEASSEEHSTREYFNSNELSGECPYITGDLGVTLIQGEGTLGKFSFNYSSVDRESGQFRLAVKTHTGFCGEFRILEGISNAFTVEDAEEVSAELPVAHVDQQNGSFSSNLGENWVSNIDPLIENEYGFPLGQWIDSPYYPLQGSAQSLTQTAARRAKRKALTWQLQSRGRRRTLKRKSRGEEEVLEIEREVCSTGSNNINGQEVGEENDEPMGLEEVDSLSCCSTSAVARDSISAKPEGSAMTLFGARVAASSSGAEEPIRETPAHPSTDLQLSTSARGNNVYHQKEDDKAMTLKDFVPQLHSTSIKKMKVPRSKEQVFTAMHLPKDTTSSCVQGEMSHRLSCDLMENSDQVYHASMIGDLHDVIGQKTRQAHIRWLKVKAVMVWWTVVRKAAARRRTIQHEGGEEDNVHKSTTMSMEVRPHSTMNQQEDRKTLMEDLMHMALQECCSKEDFPLHNSEIARGSINPMSGCLAATHIPPQITTNNINGQEIGEENDEAMGLEEVDSLSRCSTCGVARDSISLKSEGSAMTLFGVKVATNSFGAEEPIRETPAHPSTALQLSISTSSNNVNQQKEDGEAVALKDFVPQMHSTSVKKRKGIHIFEGTSKSKAFVPEDVMQMTTDGAGSTKEVAYEDDIPAQVEARELVKMDSLDFSFSIKYLSPSTGPGEHENVDNPSASPDLDLKLFGVRFTDWSSQKGTSVENLSHCAVSGLDPDDDERMTDYTCMAYLAARDGSNDFVPLLHSTSSVRKKDIKSCWLELSSQNASKMSNTSSRGNSFAMLSQRQSSPREFSFVELKSATNNFSRSIVVGEGGFGHVFKGLICSLDDPPTKIDTAFKQLSRRGLQGHKEWVTEVNALGVVEHQNLVKLLGYCCEDDERGIELVYEHIVKRSLRDHLSSRFEKPLSWKMRVRIAQGIAQALAYLHKGRDQIIYRDLKPSNILLDEKWNAKLKLSEFGLDGQSHVSTGLVGTIAYTSPEYILTGHLTAKSDIWSYGVMLFGLLTGRRRLDRNRPQKEHKLLEWVRPPQQSGMKIFGLILDPNLQGNYSLRSAQKLAVLASRCLVRNPRARPTMSQVLEMVNEAMSADAIADPPPQLPLKNDKTQEMSKGQLLKRRVVGSPCLS